MRIILNCRPGITLRIELSASTFTSYNEKRRLKDTVKNFATIARSDLLNISMHSASVIRVLSNKQDAPDDLRVADLYKVKLLNGSLIALKLDYAHLLPDNMRTMLFRFMVFLRNKEVE